MPNVRGGFQPDTKAPSSRRADFDLLRRIKVIERSLADDGVEGFAESQIWGWEAPVADGLTEGKMATDLDPSVATELYINRFDSTGLIDWSESIRCPRQW